MSSTPVKFCKIASTGKVRVYWDSEAVSTINCSAWGETVTVVYYTELIKKLLAVVKEKCQAKLCQDVLLHHDHGVENTIHHCHGCHLRMQIQTAVHLLYFIDMSPPDFHVFQSLKDSLCRQTIKE